MVPISNKFLKSFLRFKTYRWIIAISFTAFAGIFCILQRTGNLIIFPGSSDFTVGFFDDNSVGGNSQIISSNKSDSTIDFSFIIKEGFINPYVGINIEPANKNIFNILPYNEIRFEIDGQEIKNIAVYIITSNANSKVNLANNNLCFCSNLEITPEKKLYSLPLKQMKVPDWWYETNNLSPSKNLLPDWEHVIRINFFARSTQPATIIRSLRIYTISFTRDNSKLIIPLISAELLIIFLLIVFHYFKNYSKKNSDPLTIIYKPVDIENESRKLPNFLDYINNNFQNNNLSIEIVSGVTGINQRRIASTIVKTFGCNFKTYVNQIRINESKRLLKESELNIGEIAFKVGFNNQSHFNRVFKSIIGISPSEFKETQK
jgi:AraC-like DNA-binding protein